MTALTLTLTLLLGAFVLVNCRRRDAMTKEELTELFNSPVRTAERMVRAKQNMPDNARSYPFTHSGVRLTMENGERYLIHNVPDLGPVVTPDYNMRNGWREKKRETLNVDGRATLGEIRAAAGTEYRLFRNNCHGASKKMMKEAKRRMRDRK